MIIRLRERLRALRHDSESGFTLIELLISIGLSLIVMIVVGNIMLQSFRTETQVRTTSEATSLGQTIAADIQTGVRNSSAVAWSSTSAGELLVATSNNAAGTASCPRRGWYFASANGGKFYARTSAAAITAPVTGADFKTWRLVAEGIGKDGTSLFFTTSGASVAINYKITTSDNNPARFSTTVISRGTSLEINQCP